MQERCVGGSSRGWGSSSGAARRVRLLVLRYAERKVLRARRLPGAGAGCWGRVLGPVDDRYVLTCNQGCVPP